MNPIIVFLLLVAAISGFLIYKNAAHVRSRSLRFVLDVLDALLFGYVGYVAISLLLNFSAFASFGSAIRVLLFIPPISSWQTLGIVVGFLIAYSRYRQKPGEDYKDKRTHIAGRRVLCHRSALLLANSILAKRTADVNKGRELKNQTPLKRPQHLDPEGHYDKPEDDELEQMSKLKDVETNRALQPYVAEPDEFDTVAWGGIRLPVDEARKHCVIVGGTGSGKTLFIHALMKSVLPKISRPGDFRAFVYDDKLDFLPFARQLGLEQFVWNLDPYAKGGSAWDIAGDAYSPSAAAHIASALVPEDKFATQKYFDNAARQLIEAAIIRFGERCGTNWALRDLILVCLDRKRLEKFLEGSDDVMVHKGMANLLTPRDSTADVIGTLSEKLSPYGPVAALWSHAEKKVTIRDWQRSNAILLTTMRQGCSDALKPINQALFRLAASLLVDDTRRDRESWIFLDEVREIGKLDGLTAVTNKGREKGVRVVLGFQTIEGMRSEWGSESAGDEAGNICSNRMYLHSDSAKTCDWMAMHVGEVEVDETVFNHTHSRGKDGPSESKAWSTSRQMRKAMLASDFDENLKPAAPEYGITALNTIPLIGTYVSWMPWSWVLTNLPRPDPIPEELRDFKLQKLLKWDENDLDRLKLKGFFDDGKGDGNDDGASEKKDPKDPDLSGGGAAKAPPKKSKMSEKQERLWNTKLPR